MKINKLSYYRFCRFAPLLFLSLLLSGGCKDAPSTSPVQHPSSSINCIISDNGGPVYNSYLSLLARHLGQENKPLVILPHNTNEDFHVFAKFRCHQEGSPLFFLSDQSQSIKPDSIRSIIYEQTPFLTGIELAERFWPLAKQLIITSNENHRDLIQATVLAIHMKCPLIVLPDENIRFSFLNRHIGNSNYKQIYFVISNHEKYQIIKDRLAGTATIRHLTHEQAFQASVDIIGRNRIANVIAARAPDETDLTVSAVYAVPYLSAVRNAPVLLLESSNSSNIAFEVDTLQQSGCRKLRSVTIIGNEDEIALDDSPTYYFDDTPLETEILSTPINNYALNYAVGRIPLDNAYDLTMFISRSLLFSRNLASPDYSALMIANPITDFGTLPFCETIARATVQDFTNLSVPIQTFFNQPFDEPSQTDAIFNSSLIIYQGHISDLSVIGSIFPEDEAWFYFSDSESDIRDSVAIPSLDINVAGEAAANDTEEFILYDPINSDGFTEFLDETGPYTEKCLQQFPFIILQSCHSLEDSRWKWIMESGGIGLLGSSTNIHSASGSAFIKAFCNNILYRNATAGEALRDARNYFLGLDAIRFKRGHNQREKMMRVAMSFRLWGDPEQKLISSTLSPKHKPAALHIENTTEAILSIPPKKLPKVQTASYSYASFPASEAGPIVARLKNKTYRRIKSFYYFQLPIPITFPIETILETVTFNSTLSVHVDAQNTKLHIVYYPSSNIQEGSFDLLSPYECSYYP